MTIRFRSFTPPPQASEHGPHDSHGVTSQLIGIGVGGAVFGGMVGAWDGLSVTVTKCSVGLGVGAAVGAEVVGSLVGDVVGACECGSATE
jgi:hypothetical protein